MTGQFSGTEPRGVMAVSNDFIEFVLDQLSEFRPVASRKMFGGVGLYRDGLMFGLIADDVAYLKVNETNKKKFEKAGSSPFKPYADKPATMSYYEVPPDVLEDPEELAIWAAESLAIQKHRK